MSACDYLTSLVDILEITIVDATVCLFTAAVAEDLVATVARGAELQRVIFSRPSLQLDYSCCVSSGRAGKTAAMVAFRGKGAKVQYAELVMSAQASIAFAGDGLLSVTLDYKDLGSFFKILTAPCGMSFVFEGTVKICCCSFATAYHWLPMD